MSSSNEPPSSRAFQSVNWLSRDHGTYDTPSVTSQKSFHSLAFTPLPGAHANVMALPWSLWPANLLRALKASWRRCIQTKAHPLGGMRSIETISPY